MNDFVQLCEKLEKIDVGKTKLNGTQANYCAQQETKNSCKVIRPANKCYYIENKFGRLPLFVTRTNYDIMVITPIRNVILTN